MGNNIYTHTKLFTMKTTEALKIYWIDLINENNDDLFLRDIEW
jgi:hypothetical protein